MSTNRIHQYLQPPTTTQETRRTNRAPAGFVEVPTQFLVGLPQAAQFQSQVYRLAYEQAQAQARARLLDLLQSRAGLMGYDFDI